MRHRLVAAANAILSRFDLALVRKPRRLAANPGAGLELGIRHAIAAEVLAAALRGEVFTFLQIGAYDGRGEQDPATLSAGTGARKGVLVEPQPHVAAWLRSHFNDAPDIHVVECAVGAVAGQRAFHYVDNADKTLPPWVEQLGSFSREHVERMRHQVPGIQDRIREIRVHVREAEDICRSCGVDRLNLLLIDTEGADWEILKSFPITRIRPNVVILEHAHLPRASRRDAVATLLDHGYRVQVLSRDIVAESGAPSGA